MQAFPAFGVERRGAPVQAFVRFSDRPIRLRSQVYEPDFVIVQDPTLIRDVDVFKGMARAASRSSTPSGRPTSRCPPASAS